MIYKGADRGGFDKYPSKDVAEATEAVEESYGAEPGPDASEAEKRKWYGTKHKILKNKQKASMNLQQVVGIWTQK